MTLLRDDLIQLRAIEPEDLDVLYRWENNADWWEVGDTLAPFSKYVLREYIAESHRDIYDLKQLRLIIEHRKDQKAAGLMDLFNFDPHHSRAAMGMLIDPAYQHQGIGRRALKLTLEYGFFFLKLHQLYVHIPAQNTASLQLFLTNGFEIQGTLKDWLHTTEGYKDVLVLQRIHAQEKKRD